MILNEKFKEVISKEGVVSIVTCSNNEAHVVNTWNSYLEVIEDKILIPAYAMRKTEKNIIVNPNVKITVGSKEVMGFMGMGTGFLVQGTGSYLSEGEVYDMMKEKYSFLTRVLVVDVSHIKQTV